MKTTLTLTALAVSLLSAPAWAAGLADQVEVVSPYVRVAPPGAKATGAFMTLKNLGDNEVKLVKAGSTVANVTELHNHINDNGVMRMRQVPEIVVPAKGETLLKPGSYHVMLIDMKAPMKEGDQVAITLGFADGSSKVVTAVAKMPMAQAMPMDQGTMKH